MKPYRTTGDIFFQNEGTRSQRKMPAASCIQYLVLTVTLTILQSQTVNLLPDLRNIRKQFVKHARQPDQTIGICRAQR